jgi:hypothetical protein
MIGTATSRPAAGCRCGFSARHDSLRPRRTFPRHGRLFHGGSPPRAASPLWRNRRGRAQQRLFGRPLGAHFGRPDKCRKRLRNALREGLARFDGGRGWRDLGLSIDIDRRLGWRLDRTPVGTGFSDWRKAVVLSKSGGSSARSAFTDGSTGNAAGIGRLAAQARRRRFRLRATSGPA